MMPRPIVSAMAFVMKTIPTKFPTAAIATAFVGVRTFVATMVAIAFAASWNPLKKSKEKTTRIAIRMISKNAIVSSGIERVPDLSLVLRHDVAQGVRDIFAVVRRLLESFRDLLQFDDSNRVGVLEQRGDGVVHEVVRDVLEVMDLDGDPLDFVPLFHVANHADGFLQQQRGLRDCVGELDHRFGRLVDLVQIQPVRGRINHVEDVVQRAREGLDVLAVDGRDEGPVQGLEDVVREVVAAMLDVLDRASLRRDILEMLDHVQQRDRSVVHGGRDPFEEIEEPTFLRNDPLFPTQCSTSRGETPAPRAIRCTRDDFTFFGSVISASVIESMMILNRRRRACVDSMSESFILPATPGIREASFRIGPMSVSISICSYISWSVNLPAMIFFVSASAFCASIASCACSRSVSRSPMPKRREMNRGGSNFSRSSIFSPTPMKTMGAFTSATAESAPPPFAVPSSLVTMTPVIATASWNAFACGPACWPTVASRTRSRSSAWTALPTDSISLIRSGSSACRPDESTTITSMPSSALTPALAILTASFAAGSP